MISPNNLTSKIQRIRKKTRLKIENNLIFTRFSVLLSNIFKGKETG